MPKKRKNVDFCVGGVNVRKYIYCCWNVENTEKNKRKSGISCEMSGVLYNFYVNLPRIE
jgi:hypothetical protein